MSQTVLRYRFALVLMLFASIARSADITPLPPAPIQQETLTNGLRVIYLPVHQAPVVHVRMLYHVGSRDEQPDRQGFAHMFEHMMFRGSQHIGEQDFVRLIRAAGGMFNGQTDQDITTYFETLPKNQLALALYLEADRLASFRVTPEIFRVERNVVLEEISLKSEDPFVPMHAELLGEIFKSNSYRWTPLGNPKHLMTADVAELRQFFERYYVPSNAVLVIAGDFEADAARKLVRQYFEWIPRGAEIVRNIVAQPPPTAPRQIQVAEPVNNVMLMGGWQVPGYGSDDDAALIVLEQAIKIRVLQYLTLEDNHLASATYTQLSRFESDGCLCFGAVMLKDADVSRAERIINIRLQLLRDEGIVASEAQFKGLTDALCNELLRHRQTFEGFSEQIGRGVLFRNEPDATDRLITRLRNLTAPMVRQAAEKYLKPETLTFLIIRPQQAPIVPEVVENSPVVKASPQADRPPVAFPAGYPDRPPFEPPMLPARMNLAGEIHVHGLTAWVFPEPRASTVDFRFLFPCGWQDDPSGKEGLTQVTAALLVETLAKPPIGMSWFQRSNWTEIGMSAPVALLDRSIDDLSVAMRRPLLPVVDDRLFPVKWKLLDTIRKRNDQPMLMAEMETLAELFADSALGRSMTSTSLRVISRQDVDAHRQRLFNPNGAALLIRGNITPERARALLEKLYDGWTADAPTTAPAFDIEPVASGSRSRPRIILIDSADSQESFIRIASRSRSREIDKLAVTLIGKTILSQRAFQTVRSDKGYTYVVEADFRRMPGLGVFSVQTATSVAHTGTTLANLLTHIQQLASRGPTASELADAQSAQIGQAVVQFNSPLQYATWQGMMRLMGEDDDLGRYLQRVGEVAPDHIQHFFTTYAQLDQMVIVVVAPAARVKADLEPLGDVEVRPMPNRRPGAATRPAFEEIPRQMM